MEEKKYELTDETVEIDGHTLHRIKALKDFNNGFFKVKKGDLGGFIEKESNLSHEGNCWVYDNAKVYGDAIVCDNARVSHSAKVYDRARVYDNAEVYGDAIIEGNAKISEGEISSGKIDGKEKKNIELD